MTDFKVGDCVVYTGEHEEYSEPECAGALGIVLDVERLADREVDVEWMSAPQGGKLPSFTVLAANVKHVNVTPDFGDKPSGFTVKDSGERQEFGTGSVRDTRDGKGRYDLMPPEAMRRLALVYERGAAKYGDRNWEKGQPLSRYLDSCLRHVYAVLEGKVDEDHAMHAAWNLFAFVTTQERIESGELPRSLNDLGCGGDDG